MKHTRKLKTMEPLEIRGADSPVLGCAKVAYPTVEEVPKGTGMRTYLCPLCSKYHLSSKGKKR